MADVATHMLLLLQQAQVKDERPADGSFLPLSLALACLLRQLPPGLALPACGLSLHQLDHLPEHVLTRKLEALVCNGDGSGSDPREALAFVAALVQYVRLVRALLSVCHEHLSNKRSALDATQRVVGIVVDTLGGDPESDREHDDKDESDDNEDDDNEQVPDTRAQRTDASTTREASSRTQALQTVTPTVSDSVGTTASAPALAVNPSEVMKRAVSRDVGDGSAVLEILRKYSADERIQTRGVRALRSVVRRQRIGNREIPATVKQRRVQRHEPRKRSHGSEPSDSDSSSGPESGGHESGARGDSESTSVHLGKAVQWVISAMKAHPDNLSLQRDALLCLSEFVSGGDARRVAVVTSIGGIALIMDAMARLPDDVEANVGGLSVLAHPQIADESILRVNLESHRLVLSAMRRFPLSEQVQGLSCLALANLCVRHDEGMFEIVAKGGLDSVVAAMARFPHTSMLQAAGCWLFGIVSAKNAEMVTACLDAGALPVCERARMRFPDDAKVQQNALFAVQRLVDTTVGPSNTDKTAASDSSDHGDRALPLTPQQCSLQ